MITLPQIYKHGTLNVLFIYIKWVVIVPWENFMYCSDTSEYYLL